MNASLNAPPFIEYYVVSFTQVISTNLKMESNVKTFLANLAISSIETLQVGSTVNWACI